MLTIADSRLKVISLTVGSGLKEAITPSEIKSMAHELRAYRKAAEQAKSQAGTHGLPVPKVTPPMPPVTPARAESGMDAELAAARHTVDHQDYLPWAYVKAAKELLGIVDPDYLAEAKADIDSNLPQIIRAAWDIHRAGKELGLEDAFTFACGFKAGASHARAVVPVQTPAGYADPMAFINFQDKSTPRGKEWMWRDPDAGLVPIYTGPYMGPYTLTITRMYELARQAGYDRTKATVRLAYQGFDIQKFVRLIMGQSA